MQFSPVALVLGLAAAVQAMGNSSVVYTTITTDFYTTVCPTPTTFVAGNSTYTVTQSTTLTITNCPCTISHPVTTPTTSSTTTPYYYGNTTSSFVASTGVVPPVSTPVTPVTPGTPTTSTPAGFTGAAVANGVSYGAMAVAGLAAAVFL
jgi:hypothetical protein